VGAVVRFFVVTSEQGPAWVDARPMREQALWSEHAAFINALAKDASVVLGGPLRGGPGHRAMLIVQASSADDVRAVFQDDPWIRAGLLRIVQLEPWELIVSHDELDPALAKITRA
jgi:uncharacterized protein YciI